MKLSSVKLSSSLHTNHKYWEIFGFFYIFFLPIPVIKLDDPPSFSILRFSLIRYVRTQILNFCREMLLG